MVAILFIVNTAYVWKRWLWNTEYYRMIMQKRETSGSAKRNI